MIHIAAPLAQALDSNSLSVSSKRSDFFVPDCPLEQTKFAQRDFPSFVETNRLIRMPQECAFLSLLNRGAHEMAKHQDAAARNPR